MDWHYSDHSDDDTNHEVPTSSRKRSSRGSLFPLPMLYLSNFLLPNLACDQCRKTKSKCERVSGDSGVCKSCALAATGVLSLSRM